MQLKKVHWTDHSQRKMKQYGLSKTKILNVLSRPERKEEGIAPDTLAVMITNPLISKANLKLDISNGASKNRKSQWNRFKKSLGEIWIMYQDTKTERKIISAWRYPGVSKPGEEIPIPEDIKKELGYII